MISASSECNFFRSGADRIHLTSANDPLGPPLIRMNRRIANSGQESGEANGAGYTSGTEVLAEAAVPQ
jgi:hypothetical protein